MALYELAILKNGMLLYEKTFYVTEELKRVGIGIRGMFLDAVVNMAKTSMKETINHMKFKGWNVVFNVFSAEDINSYNDIKHGSDSKRNTRSGAKSVFKSGVKPERVTNNDINDDTHEEASANIQGLVYAIGDPKLKIKPTKKFLQLILDLFIETFGSKFCNPLFTEKILLGSNFDIKVEKIIGDYYATAMDRMRDLFF